MKNICVNCGKYNDIDDFGYCKKCSEKIFKQSKHTTVEQMRINKNISGLIILLILLICIGIIIYFRNDVLKVASLLVGSSGSNPISTAVQSIIPTEDKILTADNFKTLSEEYSNNNKNSDNLYYFSYAYLYYIAKDGISSAFNTSLTEEEKETNMYSRIYGKTINQLISEGKQLMLENNVTIDDYKKSLNSLNNMNNTIN